VLDGLAAWIDIDLVAWGQRYAVATACRLLYTLESAAVASKRGALEWALRTLDRRWQPLLAQVRDERALGWEPDGHRVPKRPRPPVRSWEYAIARADRYESVVGPRYGAGMCCGGGGFGVVVVVDDR
jgi:hypothetical protein